MAIKYYDGDPEKGGKEISLWDHLNRMGMPEHFKKNGVTLNPTHNCELLIPVRKALFEEAKKNMISERALDQMPTSDFEISCLYIMWLKNELKVIEKWRSGTYIKGEKKIRHSNSEQIELAKYQHFISKELSKAESSLNPNDRKSSKPGYDSLKEIFTNQNNVSKSLRILLQVEPPIIDTQNNYLLGTRGKGSIVAWVSALRKKGLIRNIPDELLAFLLNKQIVGLELGADGRTLRNTGTSAYNKYYSQFIKLLQ